MDGQMVNIEGKDLLRSAKSVDIYSGYNFEGIPNRDSMKYINVYGLGNDISTMFRGTLRYKVSQYYCGNPRDFVILWRAFMIWDYWIQHR
jgi:hypothetical protein